MFVWNCVDFVYMDWNVSNSNGKIIENRIKLKYDNKIDKEKITKNFMKTITCKLKRSRSKDIMKEGLVWWNSTLYNINTIGKIFYWKISTCGEKLNENHFYFIEKKIEDISNEGKKEFINGICSNEINENIIPLDTIDDYKTKILFIDLMIFISKYLDKSIKCDSNIECLIIFDHI